MLDEEIKAKTVESKDVEVVDDLMDELESILVKTKSDKPTKREKSDDEERKKKKSHRRNHSPSDSKYDRKKSSHKHRKRRRLSSNGSSGDSRSSGGSDNDRSTSSRHGRSLKRSKHDRNESPPPHKSSSVPDKPTPGSIYDGIVTSIMQWGCFVRLERFRNRTEGLVHISNVSSFKSN